MTARRQRGTLAHAQHRAALARARADAASTDYYAWFEKAENAKSRAWRSRYMAEAKAARARYERAERDHRLWTDRAATLEAEAVERETRRVQRERRRAERAGSVEEAAAKAQRAIERELELTDQFRYARTKAERERLRAAIDRARRDADRWLQEEAIRRAEEERRREEEERRRKRIVYEYILKVSYKARPRKGRGRPKHSHVWWDVRLRKVDGSRATEAEQEAAVRAIRRGEMLDGWEALAIGWDRAARESWSDEPSRWATSAGQLSGALASLSPTLGRDKGVDWTIGEEPIDEEDA